MIRWLVESIDAYPDLVRGIAPAGLLGGPEQQQLATFTVLKRRQDWLLGRWTAKNLLQTHLAETTGELVPLDQLWIKHEAGGAPYVTVNGSINGPGLADLLPLSLSISHSHGRAFCALYDAQLDETIEPAARAKAASRLAIGADIEHIEARDRCFVTDFFTPDEITMVDQAPPALYETLVTAIWSGKEAVLKALRLGLRVDTQAVVCDFTPLPSPAEALADWQLFRVERRGILTQTAPADRFSGWWRIIDDFVLTLAVRSN